MSKESSRAVATRETPEFIPLQEYHFKRTLSKTFMRKHDIAGIHDSIDYLIVTTAPPINPMTIDGINFWSWGILTINGIPIPAPYKKEGYTANGLRVNLTEEYSAITNSYVWLEIILTMWRAPSKQIAVLQGIFLYPGFDWIERIGEDKLREILRVLRTKALENANAYRILN
jgi:hypothetical protein